VMEERGPADSRIDLCRGCGGVWLDWFDGEATALARAVEQAGFDHTGAAGHPSLACPRCQIQLSAERFRDQGPDVLRCGDCQGLFLSDEAVSRIAALNPAAEPAADETGPLDRLIGVLRRLVGTP